MEVGRGNGRLGLEDGGEITVFVVVKRFGWILVDDVKELTTFDRR